MNVSGTEDRKKYILETTGTASRSSTTTTTAASTSSSPTERRFDRRRAAAAHCVHATAATSIAISAGCGSRTSPPAPASHGWGQGVCVGDYDNDGHRDCSSPITARACSTATTATARSGRHGRRPAFGAPSRWDTGCSFFDYDLDGRLDLVVTGYLEFDRDESSRAGQRRLLPVEGHPGHVRSARPAVRHATPLPQRGRAAGSQTSRGERHRQDQKAATASRSSPPTSTTMATPISTSPATRRRACSTTTTRTAPSRTSACSRASR